MEPIRPIDQSTNQPITEEKVVPLSAIDRSDGTCMLGLKMEPGVLVESINAVGLINPPLVSPSKNETYLVVCGFKRIAACSALGRGKITVRILKEKLSVRDLLVLAIWDNRSHRPLTVMEQSTAIHKLVDAGQQEDLIAIAHLLGMAPNRKVFEKTRALAKLPFSIQEGVAEERISFEAAVDLVGMKVRDALALYHVLRILKLSQNKEKEIIVLSREIGIREDLSVDAVLTSDGVKAILEDPKTNHNEKGGKLRSYLKQRRFPTLVEAEKRYLHHSKSLGLTEHIHMTPPAYFESSTYTLHISFACIEELHQRGEEIARLAENPAMKTLLES